MQRFAASNQTTDFTIITTETCIDYLEANLALGRRLLSCELYTY
jgi:hypothetical protein